MKCLILTLILLLPIFTFTQTTFQSVQSGPWEQPWTWGTQNFPSPGDTVIISPNHIVDYVFPLDIGNGGKLVVRGWLDLVGGLNLPPASKLVVTGIGGLHIGGNPTGYLVCDSCTFINNGGTHVIGTIEFKSGSEFHNNCLLTNATGAINFNSGLVRAVVSPGAIIDSEGPIWIGTALELNGGVLTTSSGGDIEVLPGAKITGYGSDIMAASDIINNGIIEGQNPGFHTLWDTDCSVGGTTNNVIFCDSSNNVVLCTVGAPLPADLIGIQATAQFDGSIALLWEVKTEQNLSHYEIERLTGSGWTNVGKVSPAGGGSYKYIDDPKTVGAVYYRLKMVDIDGVHEYSPIAVTEVVLPAGFISIYPNPVSNGLLNLTVESGRFHSIQITSLSGGIVREVSLTDESEIQIQIDNLLPGLYLLEAQGTSESIVQKFINW